MKWLISPPIERLRGISGMSAIEVNKLVGAVLFALLVFTAINVGFDEFLHREPLERTIYPVPGGEVAEAVAEDAGEAAGNAVKVDEETGEPAGTETAAAAPAEGASAATPTSPLAALLAAADLEKGKKISKKCAACHDFSQGGRHKVGPNLWNIVGGARAAREGYKYSSALAGLGGDWSYEDLDAFLTKPKAFVPGTKMGFPGLKEAADRAALIAYLHTLSDNPLPLP